MKCSCIICRKEYSRAGIHTHYYRTHLGIKTYSSGHNGKYDELSRRAKDRKKKEEEDYAKNPNYCGECGSLVKKMGNKFCSNSCRATFTNKNVDRTRFKPGPKKSVVPYSRISWFKCKETGKYYCNRDKNGKLRRKSPYAKTIRNPTRRKRHGDPKLFEYRQKCLFAFNVYDFPEEFDLSLIEECGFYSPTNKNNNLGGISRDHIISVKYGYDHGIDPNIIRHPANCQLLRHSDNVSKGIDCAMSLNELKKKIVEWDNKYEIK